MSTKPGTAEVMKAFLGVCGPGLRPIIWGEIAIIQATNMTIATTATGLGGTDWLTGRVAAGCLVAIASTQERLNKIIPIADRQLMNDDE